MQDIIENPLYLEEHLGLPIPGNIHAVSVCLPTWSSVVNYEENDEVLKAKLQSGYPRFVLNPVTLQLIEYAKNKMNIKSSRYILPYPSRHIATECMKYIRFKSSSDKVEIIKLKGSSVYLVVFAKDLKDFAWEFWQHTGQGLSSRQAEAILIGKKEKSEEALNKRIKSVVSKLKDVYKCSSSDVYLFQSGMAAIYHAFKAISSRSPKKKTIQVGFPYVDSLKVQQKFGPGCELITDLETATEKLNELLASGLYAGVFTEIPSNPLFQTPDLKKIYEITQQYKVPFVVDDTISTGYNTRTLPYCDIVVSSLTKNFSGTGDVMAGTAILNKKSCLYGDLDKQFIIQYRNAMFYKDVKVLDKNSDDAEIRIAECGHNAEIIADFLKGCSEVADVFYPKYQNHDIYKKFKRKKGSYGSTFSVVFKDPEFAKKFFDNLKVSKGPSLGTNYSLACPFTLLAHYNELDWAKECGVPSHLIRISVGLENTKVLIQRFKDAINA